MRHTTVAPAEAGRVTRFAWLISFLATLTLVAILALAKSAQALTVAGAGGPAAATASAPPFDLESEEEGEEEEFEVEECEEDEEECEGEAGGGVRAPEECLLTSAQATVFASSAQDKLRLVVHYTTSTPALVAVDYGLHGSRGSLYLGQSREQFAKSGVLRQTAILSEAQMTKATGAKDFTVQLYAVHAPRYCRHYFERHLTARHADPGGLTWADPETTFRR